MPLTNTAQPAIEPGDWVKHGYGVDEYLAEVTGVGSVAVAVRRGNTHYAVDRRAITEVRKAVPR